MLQGKTTPGLRILFTILVMSSGMVQGQELKQAAAAQADSPEAVDDAAATSDTPQNDKKPVAEDLLAKSIEHNWRQFSSKENVALGDVWKIVEVENERYLKCVGEPKGFLYTKKKFSDFVLTLDWKYTSDPNGNSGVLVYTQDEMRLWPVSMQIQLHQPKAGSVFPSDGAKGTSSDVASLAHEVGKWNTCRIESNSGGLTVTINGKIAAQVSGCDPAKGYIAIQCEGSETIFRRLRISELPTAAEAVTRDSPVPKADKTDERAPEIRSTDSARPAQNSDQTSG
jgi:hypothetical protein